MSWWLMGGQPNLTTDPSVYSTEGMGRWVVTSENKTSKLMHERRKKDLSLKGLNFSQLFWEKERKMSNMEENLEFIVDSVYDL